MEPNQKIPNLLHPATPAPDLVSATPSPAAQMRRRFWKLFGFDAAAVILTAGMAEALLQYIAGNLRFGIFAVVAGAFMVATLFDFLLVKDPRRRILVSALQIAVFLGFFYPVKPAAIAAAAIILVLFYLFAERAGRNELENRIKFSLWTTGRIYLKKIFVGFALATIILFLPTANSGKVFVSEQQFQRWYENGANVAHGFYSEIDFKASVGAFAETIVRTELSGNAQYKELPPELQDKAVRDNAQTLIANAGRSIGFTLTPEMPLADAFYRYIVSLLLKFKDEFGQSFLAVWAAALFFIVWSVGTLLVWVVVMAAFVVYELLASLGLVHIAGENRTKEIVELG